MRHTYDFGTDRARIGRDLLLPDAWDAVRETQGPFALPASREEWERAGDLEDLRSRAESVVAVAHELGASSLASYGVGTALLELNVNRLAPGLRLTCTDYAPRSVKRLGSLFPEAHVVCHDFAREAPVEADLHLMHRLDAELCDEAWRTVFPRFREPILFVPNVVLDLSSGLRELGRRFRHRGLTRAGWFRNEVALRSLWASTHEDRRTLVGNQDAFVLTRR